MARKAKQAPFEHRLVLNQWITGLLGYNLLEHKLDPSNGDLLRPFEGLSGCRAGIDEEGHHFFYRHLSASLPPEATITAQALRCYDRRIVRDTEAINKQRRVEIKWKYYQWLSLLFTEIYLDRYFSNVKCLKDEINSYLEEQEKYLQERNHTLGLPSFEFEDLNKICYQNATGSGKTLLMHVNIAQFWYYARQLHRNSDFLGQIILITPNAELSKQHQHEFKLSGIPTARLSNKSDLLSTSSSNSLRVLFTEVTKLGQEDLHPKKLGDQNLLIVDEGHRGIGSAKNNVGGWFENRSKLAARGFVFEYSATFKEATATTKDLKIKQSYAKSVLFDYSYGSFHRDGYGKDYRIFNLASTMEQFQFNYLAACLLTFYQQLRLYSDRARDFAGYNLEKPLWVFVGATVSKGTRRKEEEATISDVGRIISFLAEFLGRPEDAQKAIKLILEGQVEKTSLIDNQGNDMFSRAFDYLNELIEDGESYSNLYNDISDRLFLSTPGARLYLEQIKGDEQEILLRAGEAPYCFGLIKIGDAASLVSHLKEQDIENLCIRKSTFAKGAFGNINDSSSPINMLIGSRKFTEGWDCWRVSTLGLMHIGRAEGPQIIQLFGRGVRLKGHNWTLQRSGFATRNQQPNHIQHLETLNVFGVEATFIDKFKSFLSEEGLSVNYNKTYRTPLNVTYDFGHNLLVLRPRIKTDCGREYDFTKDGASPLFGEMPTKKGRILVDWYPRITSYISSDNKITKSDKNAGKLEKWHLAFLDEAELFFRLEQHKQERGWDTLNIPKSSILALLEDTSWYELLIPEQVLIDISAENIRSWQEIAAELLQKYARALYNHKKHEFMSGLLELRPLAKDDANLPAVDAYEITVDANEDTLMEDIEKLVGDLPRKKDKMVDYRGLKGCRLANHLYEPLLHYNEAPRITIKPVSLVKSEMDFIEHLADFLQDEPKMIDGREISSFLLRNESRGKGMGFFEAGNFYPDFLLWLVSEKRQGLVFIEPHGLFHEKPDSEKVRFHTTIKRIEKRLGIPGVSLHSFIITPTSPDTMIQKGTIRNEDPSWEQKTIRQWNESNVYFMEEQKEEYLEKIYTKIVKDMFSKRL